MTHIERTVLLNQCLIMRMVGLVLNNSQPGFSSDINQRLMETGVLLASDPCAVLDNVSQSP